MKTLIFKNFDNSLTSRVRVDAFGSLADFQTAGFDTRFTDMYYEEISDAAIAAGLKNLQTEDNFQTAIALAEGIAGMGLYMSNQLEAKPAAVAMQEDIALAGTSGTATVTINGNNYTATFNTSLTQTGADFVTTHAATILSTEGVVVTNNSGVLEFVANVAGVEFSISIANATGDLTGTVSNSVLNTDSNGVIQLVSPNHS